MMINGKGQKFKIWGHILVIWVWLVVV